MKQTTLLCLFNGSITNVLQQELLPQANYTNAFNNLHSPMNESAAWWEEKCFLASKAADIILAGDKTAPQKSADTCKRWVDEGNTKWPITRAWPRPWPRSCPHGSLLLESLVQPRPICSRHHKLQDVWNKDPFILTYVVVLAGGPVKSKK